MAFGVGISKSLQERELRAPPDFLKFSQLWVSEITSHPTYGKPAMSHGKINTTPQFKHPYSSYTLRGRGDVDGE